MNTLQCLVCATACLLASYVQANPRVQQLESLAAQWQTEHNTLESLRKEHKGLLDQYQDVRKQYESLQNQIEKHQREIQQSQKEKQANNKKKGNANNDKQLDQKIRDDQNAIEKLKKTQAPLTKEGKELQDKGQATEKKIVHQMQTLWTWRNQWADAADIDLSSAAADHEKTVQDLPTKKTAGALADAWQLARAIALAGNQRYDESLNTLEPLIKDDIWKAKASSLRAYIYWKQGEASKSSSEFGRAVLLDNKDPHYYLLRGIVNVQAEKYADALRLLENAEKLDVSAGHLNYWRALALALQDKPTKSELTDALHFAEAATKKGESPWLGHDALAATYAAGGDFAKAAQEQNSAIKLAPTHCKSSFETRAKAYSAGERAKYEWK
jgi:predicted Zn-dependent protease